MENLENLLKLKNVDLLVIPQTDLKLRSLYEIYKPSTQTCKLLSEKNREIFAEVILLTENVFKPRSLKEIALDVLAKNFKGDAKSIDDNVNVATANEFWNIVNINIPILQTLTIKNEQFWKRVYLEKAKDKLKIIQTRTNKYKYNWRCRGYAEKLAEVFQTTSFAEWRPEEGTRLCQLSAKYIYQLRFTHLQPVSEYLFDVDVIIRDFKVRNYDSDECHHISLECLGELRKLRYLSFEFNPPKLGYNYHARFFEFSTLDIKFLGSGLSRLKKLRILKIRNSCFDHKKLEILLMHLSSSSLQVLHLSYCHLNDDCGFILGKFLEQTPTIIELELAGNILSPPGISSLAYGIQNFQGNLKFLGLARNPIHDYSIELLARAIFNTNQVTMLNLTGIQITEIGCKTLIEIIKRHKILEEIHLGGVEIGELLGNDFIKALQENRTVLVCETRECGFNIEQELKLKLLIDRNNYIKLNPYIDSLEDMNEASAGLPQLWVTKPKNKIFLKSLKAIKEKKKCLKNLTAMSDLQVIIPDFIPENIYRPKETNDILTADTTFKKLPRVGFKEDSEITGLDTKKTTMKFSSNEFSDNEFNNQCELSKPMIDLFFKTPKKLIEMFSLKKK